MQDELRINRQILYDLAHQYLEPLPGGFSRFAYIAGLRNPSTGIYEHSDLFAVYGQQPVSESLAKCHEELFERSLEMPLVQQEEELRRYLQANPGQIPENLQLRRRLLESWIPPQAPDYLKELFRSNLGALWELLREGNSKARSGT